jgi:hypothetical protein
VTKRRLHIEHVTDTLNTKCFGIRCLC